MFCGRDIIGGEVKCDGDPTLSHQDLPDKWLQDTIFNTHTEGGAHNADAQLDAWKLVDPKSRKPASFWNQLTLYTLRALQQQYRPLKTVMVDYALIFVSGTLLGMSQHNSEVRTCAAPTLPSLRTDRRLQTDSTIVRSWATYVPLIAADNVMTKVAAVVCSWPSFPSQEH